MLVRCNTWISQIDDPKLKIEKMRRDVISKPMLYSYYLILNGNDEQLRKAGNKLFGFDTFSLSETEFQAYHQILWLMTAILPYEKHRIFPLVFKLAPSHRRSHFSSFRIVRT